MDKLFQDGLLEGVGSNSIRLLPQAVVQRSVFVSRESAATEAAFPANVSA
jgi:hypothetical protein